MYKIHIKIRKPCFPLLIKLKLLANEELSQYFFPLLQLPILFIEYQPIKHTLHLLEALSTHLMVYVDVNLGKATTFAQFILHV